MLTCKSYSTLLVHSKLFAQKRFAVVKGRYGCRVEALCWRLTDRRWKRQAAGCIALSECAGVQSIVAVGLCCGGASSLDEVRRSLCSLWVLVRGGVRRRIIAVGLWWCSSVCGLGKVRRRYHIAVRRQKRARASVDVFIGGLAALCCQLLVDGSRLLFEHTFSFFLMWREGGGLLPTDSLSCFHEILAGTLVLCAFECFARPRGISLARE